MASQIKTGMFHGTQPVTLAGFTTPIANVFSRMRKSRQAAADAKMLKSYSDRQLADIGISRSQINAIVLGKLPHNR